MSAIFPPSLWQVWWSGEGLLRTSKRTKRPPWSSEVWLDEELFYKLLLRSWDWASNFCYFELEFASDLSIILELVSLCKRLSLPVICGFVTLLSVKMVCWKSIGGDWVLSELTNWMFFRGIRFDLESLVTDWHELVSQLCNWCYYGLVSLFNSQFA